MRKINGFDLSSKIDYKLSDRQTFEYVYSLLVSVLYLKSIPADRHLDNYMVENTSKPLSIRNGNRTLYFSGTYTIVHIDYQVFQQKTNLKWSDLDLRNKLSTNVSNRIRHLLNLSLNVREKIEGLWDVFEEYSYTKSMFNQTNQTNQTCLEFV